MNLSQYIKEHYDSAMQEAISFLPHETFCQMVGVDFATTPEEHPLDWLDRHGPEFRKAVYAELHDGVVGILEEEFKGEQE